MKKLTTINDKIKKTIKLADTEKIKMENYGVCFQFYQENYQHTPLGKMKIEELKAFEKLILEVIKCKNEQEFSRINKGKNKMSKTSKFYTFEHKDEVIHIGKEHTPFRLHGLLIGKTFKIISIDPKHLEHK